MPGMDRTRRRSDLLAAADAVGAAGVLLRSPASFAWYTGGADNRVDHDSAGGAAAIVVTDEGEWVVTDEIEGDRFREEEVGHLGIEVVTHPWYGSAADVMTSITGGRRLAGDLPGIGDVDAGDALARLRYVLDDRDIERYRGVGADARGLLGDVALAVEPTTTEQEAAAMLAAEARRRGGFAPVALVAGAERLPRYRHPVPSDAPLGRRAMLVVSFERGGLYASFTAFVHFEPPDDEQRRGIDACEEVLRRMREEATKPGRTLGEIFDDCRRFYADAGFPDEWRHHHQGGIAGYRSREVIARPGEETVVAAGQAFAWNPSVRGAKAEETFVLTGDGPEVLT